MTEKAMNSLCHKAWDYWIQEPGAYWEDLFAGKSEAEMKAFRNVFEVGVYELAYAIQAQRDNEVVEEIGSDLEDALKTVKQLRKSFTKGNIVREVLEGISFG